MRRITICLLGGLLAIALTLVSCSQSEVNPYDATQDQTPPVVTSFVYSGGQASWSTDEEALCVLEYGEVGEDFEHYVYEATKYYSTHHTVKLLGMDEGVDYVIRVRSMDRAGHEAYEAAAALPDTVTGRAFRDETMSLAMIDVGWGLSELLTTPSGEHILIDASLQDTTGRDRAISLYAKHLAFRMLQSNSQRDLRCVSHSSDGEESLVCLIMGSQ